MFIKRTIYLHEDEVFTDFNELLDIAITTDDVTSFDDWLEENKSLLVMTDEFRLTPNKTAQQLLEELENEYREYISNELSSLISNPLSPFNAFDVMFDVTPAEVCPYYAECDTIHSDVFSEEE